MTIQGRNGLTGFETSSFEQSIVTPGVPPDYFSLSQRKLNPRQILEALQIHEEYQLGELGRYIRIDSKDSRGVAGLPTIFYGIHVLMKSEGVRDLRFEADTAAHVRFYTPLFPRTAILPQTDSDVDVVLFEVSQDLALQFSESSGVSGTQ